MKIGTNLFGIGQYISDDPHVAVKQIKEAGFASVEPMILFFSAAPERVRTMGVERVRIGLGKQKNSIWMDEEAAEKIRVYRENGLEVVSAQVFGFANRMIPDAPLAEAMVRFGKENKLYYFVISGKAACLEEADSLIPSMNALAQTLKENGMQLVYHNHEQEMNSCGDITVLEHIMERCPDIALELDVGWVQFAGEDPVPWIRRYQDRMVLLHIKDICGDACAENKATCYRAVGEGCIDLKKILEAADECRLDAYGLIIDQDDAQFDIFEESRRGIRNISDICENISLTRES